MKVIIICIVLFALTYNVNGAPADNVDSNDLMQLLKKLKTQHSADNKEQDVNESETAPVAKLDDNSDNDNEMIEALFVASLMNEMDGVDNVEWKWLRNTARKVGRFYNRHQDTIHKLAGCVGK